MRVGVVKIGSRISFSSQGSSGSTGEAVSIINMLVRGGDEVTVFTKILDKDVNPSHIAFKHIAKDCDTSQLDYLVVINGNCNFFGGAEDVEQILNYKIINGFKGPVFYIYCDPELTLKQIWPSVSKKPWAGNWAKQDIEITRKDIVYISQPFDTDKVMQEFKKQEIIPSQIIHYPFERFPCLNPRLSFNENPDVDLSYGGTMRGNRRIKKMVKFYFNHPSDISVEMFGKIEFDDFKEYLDKVSVIPSKSLNFTGPVKYDQMLSKMNASISHCVIGDPYYEEISDLPQRTLESVQASVVTFIDADLDKARRVYGADKNLADFLYVQSRQELSEKIQLLKLDTASRRQIVDDQFVAVAFDADSYCKDFTKLLSASC
jgi:hypothetical protein